METRAVTKVAVATVKAVVKVATTVAATVSYVARKVVAPAVKKVVNVVKAVGTAIHGAGRSAIAATAKYGDAISLTATVVGIGICAATAGAGCLVAAGAAVGIGAFVAGAKSIEKHGDIRRAGFQAAGSVVNDVVTGAGAGRIAQKAFGSKEGIGRAAVDLNGAPAVLGTGMSVEAGIDWLCDQTKGSVC